MTIYDIARETGLSIATISRVLNNDSRVSAATRERVQRVIEAQGYVPSGVARGLAVNATRTVGLAVIDVRDAYYANVSYIIEQELSAKGYNCLLCNTGVDSAEKRRYLGVMLQRRVDAIVLVGSVFTDKELDEAVARAAARVPVVIVNGDHDCGNVYSLVCDDAAGTRECVALLAARGRRHIVYLSDAATYSAAAKLEGFRQGMAQAGLPLEPHSVLRVPKGIRGAQEAVDALLAAGTPVDAIMAGEDMSALGAVKAAKSRGMEIPRDLSVIGYNNSALTDCCLPELSSVDSRMEELARKTARLLCDLFEGRECRRRTVVPPVLVRRGSF